MNQNRYHLGVRDFGPIIEADIELRPLSVFIGPSNTGKSWMAILIYALHQFFASDYKSITAVDIATNFDLFFGDENDRQPGDTLTQQIDGLQKILADFDANDEKNIVSTNKSIVELLKPSLDGNGERLKLELCRCFGTNADGFIRRAGKTKPKITMRRTSIEDSESYDCKYEFAPLEGSLKSNFSENFEFKFKESKIFFQSLDEAITYEHYEGWFLMILIAQIVMSIRREMVGPLSQPAYYFPADRTGIMHAHNVVVSSLIESSSTIGLRPSRNSPMLTGVLADFLDRLIQVGSISKKSELDATHAMELERSILQGEVGVERGEITNYPNFTYQPYGWESSISLSNASSMVSELAPIVLYLRHIVLPNSILLVEEPESHLHPAMQVEFIRQLANLVHSGIRVIVTTHSEYLMEEVGNIVRRSSIDKKSRLKEISDSDAALDPSDVGVWFFKPKKNRGRTLGSKVEEVRLDESGLYQTGFDDVAMALHNDWANISSEIGNTD